MKDLVILVADKNAQFALRGALHRPDALGIRAIAHEFRAHMGRDGGARTSGVDLLARERARFTHALLVFDLQGSGAAEERNAEELEHALDADLHALWGTDAKAIVIAPELDTWVWGGDNVLGEIFQWPLDDGIRDWLKSKGFDFDVHGKPLQPKEALDAMRSVHQLPRSSALYEKITSRISLRRCVDPAFSRLRTALQGWFAV